MTSVLINTFTTGHIPESCCWMNLTTIGGHVIPTSFLRFSPTARSSEHQSVVNVLKSACDDYFLFRCFGYWNPRLLQYDIVRDIIDGRLIFFYKSNVMFYKMCCENWFSLKVFISKYVSVDWATCERSRADGQQPNLTFSTKRQVSCRFFFFSFFCC